MLVYENAPSTNDNTIDEFYNNIEAYVESGIFQFKLAELLLAESATLEALHTISKDIGNTTDQISVAEAAESGPEIIGASLGIDKSMAEKLTKDPKTARVAFRALRDKLEEMEDRARRARAEESGFITTVIYTIRQALIWLVKKFKDIKDDVMDMIHDREVGSSQAKRDYVWLINKNVDYMSQNAKWW